VATAGEKYCLEGMVAAGKQKNAAVGIVYPREKVRSETKSSSIRLGKKS